MADVVAQGKTCLTSEEVIVRAVQFFSTESWRPTGQSARTATFEGKPKIPWFMLLLTYIGFLACVVPGIIMYIMVIRKLHRFHNLVVTATPVAGGSEVVVQHPPPAKKLARRFLEALPRYEALVGTPKIESEMVAAPDQSPTRASTTEVALIGTTPSPATTRPLAGPTVMQLGQQTGTVESALGAGPKIESRETVLPAASSIAPDRLADPPTSNPLFCDNCGVAVVAESRFCEACGAAIS